jgi:hypothetical protein
MRKHAWAFVFVAVTSLVWPTVGLAQSAIAGTVKDSTGAVLPGVTVEASSPALIEKVKTTNTDQEGQYRIVDLRPGTYTVNFSLTGFTPVIRESVVLEASFTAPINVEMRVGTVEESVTVAGASPVVDVQTSQRRELVSQQFVDSLPTSRNYALLAGTVPAIFTGAFDVGGSSTMTTTPTLAVHGSLTGDSRTLIDGFVVDGMSGSGQCACLYDSESQTQEIAVQVSGGSAENQLSGVLVNRIPRTGGNTFGGDQVFLFSNGSLQGQNLDDALRARGITTPARLDRQYDINYSLGGPIVKDKLWFYASGRQWSYNSFIANAFNPDGGQAIDDNDQQAFPVRLTSQLSPKNRLTGLFDWTHKFRGHQNLSPTVPPKATLVQTFPGAFIIQAKMTSTLTNHLLLEGGYNRMHTIGDNQFQPDVVIGTCHVAYTLCAPGTGYGDIAHQDTLLGTNTVASASGTGAFSGPNTNRHRSNVAQASLSYVTGAHALKVGFQHRWGWTTATRLAFNADLVQVYRNGAPFAVTILNTPTISENDVNADLGVFVQDVWTRKRLTLSPGLRWDHFNASVPEQTVGAGRFVPVRHFDAIPNLPNWNNVAPRIGASYDPTGKGKTAVKGTVGLYVQSQGPGFAATYNPLIVSTDQRTWSDLNRDDIAQENEIGPPTNLAFGIRRNQNPDPNIKRQYQLVWDVGIQHELVSGIGLSVSYNERRFSNIIWTQNLAVNTVTDYTLVTTADPTGNGQALPVYNLAASKLGQINELDTNSPNNRQWYKGVDVSVNMRWHGASLYGGTSTGRTITVTCDVADPNNLRFCDQTQYDAPLRTLFKLAGTLPFPYGLRLSGTLQSTPNSERIITYQVTRALIPTLTQTSVNVRLNEPGSVYNDRVNQLDLNLTKSLRVNVRNAKVEFRPELALYNVFNANPVLAQLNVYGPTLNNVSSILGPRLLRLGLTVKF